MPLVRWRLITCLLTLGLSLGLSGPVQAQRELLSLDPALPIEGLSQADLDAVSPERLLCRSMLSAVNDMVALLERSPNPDSQYKTAVRAARSSWPRTRGRCDAAVGDLDEGWPRSVLRQEFEQVMGLWTALIQVAQAHSSAASSKEVEAALDNYQARLDVWREWLDRSLDFWAGAWLSSHPDPTCSTEAQTRGAALGKKIWLLATRPPDQRSDESISDISIRLTAERDSLGRCSGDTPLDTVTLALLRRRLAAYEEGLAGLKADDDPQIRRAMETEQRLVARALRCRQEHERGSPSGDCSP